MCLRPFLTPLGIASASECPILADGGYSSSERKVYASVTLSEAALTRFHLPMERHGAIIKDDSNYQTDRELASAGLMIAGHSSTVGLFIVACRRKAIRCTPEERNRKPGSPSRGGVAGLASIADRSIRRGPAMESAPSVQTVRTR
jgi:hypothetical protein